MKNKTATIAIAAAAMALVLSFAGCDLFGGGSDTPGGGSGGGSGSGLGNGAGSGGSGGQTNQYCQVTVTLHGRGGSDTHALLYKGNQRVQISASKSQTYEKDTYLTLYAMEGANDRFLRFEGDYYGQNVNSCHIDTSGDTAAVNIYFGTLLPAPNNVTATAANGSATIRWNSVSGAESYNLYYGVPDSGAGGFVLRWTKRNSVTSPYNLSGLNNGSIYGIRISAQSAGNGEGAQSEPVWVSPEPQNYAIRDRGPAGGWIIYDKGNYSDGWRYLEAAPADVYGEWNWGIMDVSVSDTGTQIGAGKQNTLNIKNANPTNYYAANCAYYYSINNFSDWYLPSRDELKLMHTNLHQNNLGNFVGSDPFDFYWSSSESSNSEAWTVSFYDSSPRGILYEKNWGGYVRPIRAF